MKCSVPIDEHTISSFMPIGYRWYRGTGGAAGAAGSVCGRSVKKWIFVRHSANRAACAAHDILQAMYELVMVSTLT